MRAFCRYTRKRFEPSHGDVITYSWRVFRVPSRATHTPTNTPTDTHQHTRHHHTTTHTHTHHTARTHHHHTTHTMQTNTTQNPVYNRQPTVILREFQRGENVNGHVHPGQPTMILHSIKIFNICGVCNFYADLLFWNEYKSVINIRNWMRIYCFGINLIFPSVIIFAGMVFR